MPLLDDKDQDMEQFATPNSFAFSGQRINTLGATEFTIAGLACDSSGSVSAFKTQLEKCLAESVKAMRKSPRADNMMVRTTTFDSDLSEVHGFKALNNINPGDFDNQINPGGSTALFDAVEESVNAMLTYAKAMTDQDFSVNGILIVVTDGDDNCSVATPAVIRKVLTQAVQGEMLESLVSILVGVNITDSRIKAKLDKFHKDAGFTQFEVIDNATEKTLARLAQFISKSVSAQSQALGTGGPSKSLSF